MSDQIPDDPAPAHPPVGSREPDWTTGQGVGFLVALPGWIIVGLAGIGALAAVYLVAADSPIALHVVIGVVSWAVFGVIIAIPGTIVFNKCKRR